MEINKVVYGDKTLIDLTNDTVTPDTLLKGATAHNAAGVAISGNAASGTQVTVGGVVQNTWNADTKVDKLRNNNQLISAYMVSPSSNSISLYQASTAVQTGTVKQPTLMIRNIDGHTEVSTPVSNKDASNKDYVDNIGRTKLFPVGAIYMSVNSTSPASFIGGSWTRIQDTFLLAAGSTYTAGATGGQATYKLTNSQLPQNIGTFSAINWKGNAEESGIASKEQLFADRTFPSGSDAGTAKYKLSGGGAAIDNMPPYLSVYVWKRTA